MAASQFMASSWQPLDAIATGPRTGRRNGGDGQVFGGDQQDPYARGCYQNGDGSVSQFPCARQVGEPRFPLCGVTLPVFYRPLVALKLNMSWNDPELYLFLCVIAVFAGVLAIIDECIQKFCRRKPKQGDEPAYLRKTRPLDGLLRGRPLRRRVAYNLRIRARR